MRVLHAALRPARRRLLLQGDMVVNPFFETGADASTTSVIKARRRAWFSSLGSLAVGFQSSIRAPCLPGASA
jgi:hypothetical protein